MNVTKSELKQIERASRAGKSTLMQTFAILHRAGSARTQKAIILAINESDAVNEFFTRNGALLHKSEA